MKTVSLQQICDIQIGKTPSRSVPEYWGGELPWVTISDFAAGRIITKTKERITRLGAEKSRSKRIPRGTLLLSFKLSLGKRAVSGCDLFTNEAIAALQIIDHHVADRDYLYWTLGSIDYDRLVDRAAKGKTLNKAKLKVLKIPLPPLDEQKRIAGILDAADALRAKRREALTQLDILLQSTFLDMFGDPVTNPMGWDQEPLGKVIRVKSGDGLVSKDMAPDGKFPVYGGNGISGYHDSFMFKEPRIVLGRVGVNCGAVHLTKPCAWVTDNALYVHTFIRPIDTTYLVAALKMANINQYASQSAQPLISGTRIYPVQILIPPLDLQHRFTTIVESVEQQKTSQRAHLDELDTLFASLQSRAFRGDL